MMTTNLQIARSLESYCANDDDQKIDVVNIRLIGGPRSLAVLGEFRAADRLLASWMRQAKAPRSIDFQVTFTDGCVMRGRYECGRKEKRVPALSRHVREELALLSSLPASTTDWSRYAVEPH